MQYLQAKPGLASSSERQQHRLETANLIIEALGESGLSVFGARGQSARLAFMSQGGMSFIPRHANAAEIPIDTPVRGRERLLPGFNASYAEQRLLRCLGAFVREGRSIDPAMLIQAMIADGRRTHEQIEPGYKQLLARFRFTRAFGKPGATPQGMATWQSR